MLTVAAVLAVLAALLHVYIWVLESLRWEAPATRATFGISAEQAAQTKQLAFNQGFYNLFLAVVAVIGVVLLGPERHAGVALVAAGTGSMLAAALVLGLSDRSKLRAAVTQGTVPALAVVALALGA